jgi:hypothetical protein
MHTMKHLYFAAITSLLLLSACKYVTYTPRAKSQKRREKPSIFICERIVEFRQKEGRWPYSRADFISKGQQYYDVLKGFKYNAFDFSIKDSNTMTAYFSDHIQDQANYELTRKVDLGDYGGRIRFFRVKDKFVYKIKMN